MKDLGKIFNSGARVKIMRLFLFNENIPYDIEMIARRTKTSKPTARKEVKILVDTGFIKKKDFVKKVTLVPKPAKKTKPVKGKKKTAPKKEKKEVLQKIVSKKVKGFMLNSSFPLTKPLRSLLIDSELVHTKSLGERFKPAGKIKMIVLSGIFMKDNDRSVDVLVVGEKLDMKKMHRTMQGLEAEVGKELRYSIFNPEEFKYRLDMYDQHLLDVFEYPHERVMDKIKPSI